jgi:hypothetical protein
MKKAVFCEPNRYPIARAARFHMLVRTVALLSGLLLTLPLAHAQFTAALNPSLPAGAPVGTQVIWQAVVQGYGGARLPEYRFEGRLDSGPWSMLRDFSIWNALVWAPLTEGGFEIRVTVRDPDTEEQAEATALYVVTSRLSDNQPAVVATQHPLVALYSAPPCNVGSIRVRFRRANGTVWQQTTPKPCDGPKSLNFYVAGMVANTNYLIQHEFTLGRLTLRGPVLSFRTGIPPWPFPTFSPEILPNGLTSLAESIVLHSSSIGGTGFTLQLPVATDLLGNVVWYYDRVPIAIQDGSLLTRPLAGGTMLVILSEFNKDQVLREIDLAGNPVRETRAANVSEQLVAMGQDPIGSFHHEATRLPNGHTLVLASVERILADVQGPGPQNVVGDMIVDLDQNLQVVWAWNSFEHLDTSRAAILGQVCQSAGPGCPPLFLGQTALDWTHSNSIGYSLVDGNIVVSVRHQDWVIKIDYGNGSGSGNVIWRLGKDGDFVLNSDDPWPWFSHQHDAEYDGLALTVFDNGNTRRAESVTPEEENSRGQVLLLNEGARTAVLVGNFDLGHFATAVGSAQRLTNGNYHFLSGSIDTDGVPPPFDQAQSQEFTPLGVESYALTITNKGTYRSFRMKSLYEP